jgi:hypothetical protein
MKRERAHQLLAIVFCVAAIILPRILLQAYYIEKGTSDYCQNMNNECPIYIGGNKEFTIEEVKYTVFRTINYTYKIPFNRNAIRDIESYKNTMINFHLDELNELDSLKILQNKNVHIIYTYIDVNDEKLFSFKVLYNFPYKASKL